MYQEEGGDDETGAQSFGCSGVNVEGRLGTGSGGKSKKSKTGGLFTVLCGVIAGVVAFVGELFAVAV